MEILKNDISEDLVTKLLNSFTGISKSLAYNILEKNNIKGSILYDDIADKRVLLLKQLVENKTTPRNRDEKEIMGYRDVLNTIHENYEYIPMRPNYLLQLHRDLYKYSHKNIGGSFKNTQNYISAVAADGREYVLFTPPAPYETPAAIDAICESFNRMIDSQEVDSLILIPVFIHDFLCIHPFNDGNGRMSRLLTLLLLYRSGYIVGKYVSMEMLIEKTKETYYEALQNSSIEWHNDKSDYTSFVRYYLGVVLKGYNEFQDPFCPMY